MQITCASFNVLANAYLTNGSYPAAVADLLTPSIRIPLLVKLIKDLGAGIIALQEVEPTLVEALTAEKTWQLLWTSKSRGKSDGCLLLVRQELQLDSVMVLGYEDGSGHIAQSVTVGGITFCNTHLKWSPPSSRDHIGAKQLKILLSKLGAGPTVIMADSNDRPGGPIRRLIKDAGFRDVTSPEPTAVVDGQSVALDIIAARGLFAQPLPLRFQATRIPSRACPSDHVPVMATVTALP